MYSNQVWELVETLKGIKLIGCKWFHKRKRGLNGKVETFKTRLVTESYNKKPSFDHKETFSPIIMLKSIRIFLSIVAHLDYEIWKMDVKTAFSNDNLDKSIYIMYHTIS